MINNAERSAGRWSSWGGSPARQVRTEGDFPEHVAVIVPDFYPGELAPTDLAIVQANTTELAIYLNPGLRNVSLGYLPTDDRLPGLGKAGFCAPKRELPGQDVRSLLHCCVSAL